MIIRHTHSSSRYDRSEASLHAAMVKYAQWADIVTFTEVHGRASALKVPGFDVSFGRNGPKDDCAVVWDNEKYKRVHAESHRAGQKLFRMGSHLSSPLYAHIVVLEEMPSGKRIVVGACHFPSDVETPLSRHRKTDRVIAWTQAVNSARRRMNRLKKQYKAKGKILSADWNINFKHRWARALVKSHFPFWNLVWSKVKRLPGRGTHGTRLIDGSTLQGFKVRRGFVNSDDNSSDHRPWSEELELAA